MSSFFKRLGRDTKGGSPAKQSPPPPPAGTRRSGAPGGDSSSTNGPSASGSASPTANVAAMPTSGTDPETCLEVFRSHWLQAVTLMNKVNMAPTGGATSARSRGAQEEIEAVRQHIDHLMMLLVEEAGEGSDQHGQVQLALLFCQLLPDRAIGSLRGQHPQSSPLRCNFPLHVLSSFLHSCMSHVAAQDLCVKLAQVD